MALGAVAGANPGSGAGPRPCRWRPSAPRRVPWRVQRDDTDARARDAAVPDPSHRGRAARRRRAPGDDDLLGRGAGGRAAGPGHGVRAPDLPPGVRLRAGAARFVRGRRRPHRPGRRAGRGDLRARLRGLGRGQGCRCRAIRPMRSRWRSAPGCRSTRPPPRCPTPSRRRRCRPTRCSAWLDRVRPDDFEAAAGEPPA